MARTKRSAKLDTWNARKKLKMGQMHQERLSTGQYIAYRKPTTGGAGTWFARWWNDSGKILQTRLGTADDFQDADGEEVLAYPQAQARAIHWFKTKERQANLEADGEIVPKGSFYGRPRFRRLFQRQAEAWHEVVRHGHQFRKSLDYSPPGTH